MNEELQRQLLRQLRILNFWVKLFGAITIVTIVIVAYAAFKIISFAHKTDQKLQSIQQQTIQKFDLKKQACEGSGTLSDLVRDKTSTCN